MEYDQSTALKRLFSRCVARGECFEFTGPLNRNGNGYTKIGIGGKNRLGHRVVFSAHYGEIPDGFCVMHKCDNTRCLNPAHLMMGTKKDNSQDMVKKGRHRSGVITKLTSETLMHIAEYRIKGYTQKQISSIIGICRNTVTKGCKIIADTDPPVAETGSESGKPVELQPSPRAA